VRVFWPQGFSIFFLILFFFSLKDTFLKPYRVRIIGVSPLTEKEVTRKVQESIRRGGFRPDFLIKDIFFTVPLQGVEIEKNPWDRVVDVRVFERTPFISYMTRSGEGILLDEEGEVVSLRREPSLLLWDRPILRLCPEEERGTKVFFSCLKDLVVVARFLSYAYPSLFLQISDIVPEGENFLLYTQQGVVLVLLPPPFTPQLDDLLYAWKILQEKEIKFSRLRRDRPGQVTVQPSKKITPERRVQDEIG
jgi:hypothetical protein